MKEKKPRNPNPPPEGRKWKPGQSGNPNGRPKIPDDIKVARKLTFVEFERICHVLFGMSQARLEEVIEDKNTPVLTALVARILCKGIDESSKNELNYFIERFFGKVPDQTNISGNLNGGLVDFIAARGKAPSKDDE